MWVRRALRDVSKEQHTQTGLATPGVDSCFEATVPNRWRRSVHERRRVAGTQQQYNIPQEHRTCRALLTDRRAVFTQLFSDSGVRPRLELITQVVMWAVVGRKVEVEANGGANGRRARYRPRG